jgi:hypothetical protein
MKKAALGLITVVLASSALAAPLQHQSFSSRTAAGWANAIIGVLAANAYGYGPGYNVNPGYAFARGPDIGALAMVLHPRTFPPAVANETLIADARGIDDPSQSGPR